MADGDVLLLPTAEGQPHPLGRHVNHDPLSRAFAVGPVAALPSTSFRHRRYGVCVDQDGLGECVIGAGAHLLNCHPNRAHFAARNLKCLTTAWLEPMYERVTAVDPFSGQYPPDDTGTDANSFLKVVKGDGLIPGYEWAFGGMAGLSTLQVAPYMQGTEWTETMFYPDADGRVHVTGQAVGGHETVVIGYEQRSTLTHDDDRVWCLNDWSTPDNRWGYAFSSTGIGNYFYIVLSEWLELIDNRSGDLARPRWAA